MYFIWLFVVVCGFTFSPFEDLNSYVKVNIKMKDRIFKSAPLYWDFILGFNILTCVIT